MLPLDISQIIYKSQELPGWCQVSKAERLSEFILERKPDIVVETGIFGGRSLIPMAAACKWLRKGMTWGIDPWEKAASIEGEHKQVDLEWWSKLDHEDVYRAFVRGTLDFNLGSYCRWLRMKSDQAVKLFENASIGMFHQDSNHSQEVSCREIDLWKFKVAPGGIWVLDDVDWQTNQRAYRTLKEMAAKTLFDDGKWAAFEMP